MGKQEPGPEISETAKTTAGPDRREFFKLAVGSALGGFLSSTRTASANVHKNAPGIKLCAQSSANPGDDELLFLKQIGAEYVSVGSTPELRTA
jgi:mannonate dehydratase